MRGCAGVISTESDMQHEKWITHVLSGIIRHPADEGDLVALALAVGSVVLDVVDGVATANAGVALAVVALGADELLAESLVVVLARLLLDDNLLVVIGDLVDHPLEALAELELVEGSDALGSDGDTVGGVLMVVGLGLGGRARVRLVSGGTEEAGGELRDSLAVNERTLRKPVRLVVSIAVLLLCDTP